MTSRSGKGSRDRVAAARRQARSALGRDDTPGLFDGPAQARAATPDVEPQAPREVRPSEAVGVLTLSEAATRLGLSRSELGAMIAAGKVEALPTGFTQTIPTREVERLQRFGNAEAYCDFGLRCAGVS